MVGRPPPLRWLVVALGCVGLAALPAAGRPARAAGFAILETSASGLGTAFAGTAARAEDASTVFTNPAGMVALDANQISVAGHLLLPRADYGDDGSTIVTGEPLLGDEHDDGAETVLVPNLYAVYGPIPRLKLGLAVNAPFGLATDWDDDFVGRYHALRSEVRTININPSVAFALTDWLAVGAGLNVQYIDAELTNAIDLGTIAVLQLGQPAAAALGLAPQQNDGFARVEGHDWSLGYNLGVLVEPRPGTRVGLAFRSKVSHDLNGEANFRVPPEALPLTAGGAFTDTGASAKVDLPETVTLSVQHRIGRRWAVLGDIAWTNWSHFDELRIGFANGQPDSVRPEDWHDSFRYAVGATYDWSDNLVLRVGLAFDESPVPDRTRTPRIPDGDRFWTALGFGYRFGGRASLDLGYAHLFVEDGDIDLTDPVSGNLRGSTDNAVDIVSAQFNFRF